MFFSFCAKMSHRIPKGRYVVMKHLSSWIKSWTLVKLGFSASLSFLMSRAY